MHASMFHIDLEGRASSRDRDQSGRALATVLGAVPGFVAFIALEAEDGTVGGLCIGVDAGTLEGMRQVMEAWQRERGQANVSNFQPLISGEVIVQRGL